jgi:hypothetical protein
VARWRGGEGLGDEKVTHRAERNSAPRGITARVSNSRSGSRTTFPESLYLASIAPASGREINSTRLALGGGREEEEEGGATDAALKEARRCVESLDCASREIMLANIVKIRIGAHECARLGIVGMTRLEVRPGGRLCRLCRLCPRHRRLVHHGKTERSIFFSAATHGLLLFHPLDFFFLRSTPRAAFSTPQNPLGQTQSISPRPSPLA